MHEMCIECKVNVVYYYRGYFCEDCIKDFFEGGKEDKQGYSSVVRCGTDRMAKASDS